MVHSHILEGDLLLLLKREVTGVLGPLEDNTFGGYKSYNRLTARQAMVLVTPRVPQAYLSYQPFMMLNRQQPKWIQ